ncbi:MAG: hypothetical protein ACLGIG_04235, partial [Actinomycetes bacterium]
AVVTIPQGPSILVDKSAEPTSGLALGDEVVYTVTVENDGNVTLSDVTVTDPLCTPVYVSGDDGDDLLQVEEVWTYECTYEITQADVDAGSVTNTADGSAFFGDTEVTDDGTAVVTIPQNPALSITKVADPTSYSAVGDVITYTYVVTNTGDVTLPGPFTVDDDKATVTCPDTASLALGASITCTASYTITQADLDAGEVTNVATATNGTVTSPPATATITRTAVLSQPPTVLPFVPEPEPQPRTLPFTGVELLPALVVGAGVTLAGALLTGTVRRRREDGV